MVTKWKGGKLCAVLSCLVMSDLKGGGEGLIKRLELIYTLCYVDLLNRSGNCTQYYVKTSNCLIYTVTLLKEDGLVPVPELICPQKHLFKK